MNEFLEIIFRDFWTWLGFTWILYILTKFLGFVINRILRYRNIRKYGYPPPHCDADGDFRPIRSDDVQQT